MGKTFNTGTLVNGVTVLSNGNVGIGVTSPNGLLSIKASLSDTPALRFQNNITTGLDAALSTYVSSTQTYLLISTNSYINSTGNIVRFNTSYESSGIAFDEGNIRFLTSTTSSTPANRMTITTSGNVGIGMPPIERLSISGSNGVAGMIRWTDSATASAFLGITSGGLPYIHSNNTFLAFGANGSNNFTETMRISNGNLGIGTTTPDALLRIDSNVASANNTMLYLYNADYTGTTRSFVRVRNNISAGSTYSSYFGQGADRKTYIIANDTSRNDIVINGDNGYVGVGTNSPSYLLDVSGSIKAGRVVYQWYWGSWQGNNTYWHIKTNLWGGGSPNGNSQYTMSFFKGYSYSYSASILEGSCGFHNWGGTIYSYRTTGNIFSNVYVSSDGYVVLVIPSGLGETGVVIDWHQHFEYPTRVCQVTAAGLHGSISGKY